MGLAIQRLNGELYNLSEYNLKVLDFQVDSPKPRVESEVIEGRDGVVETEITYDVRTLRASFFFKSIDNIDFALLRNEIFRMFSSKDTFYLIDSREPGKRWLVRANGFSVEQIMPTSGRFDVGFVVPHTFAESYGSTLEPYNFDGELWQIGTGLEAEDLNYTHSSSTFNIYNGSDITIDPRECTLKIEFIGASNNLTIRNLTTGDEWVYNGISESGDIMLLDGIKSLKNEESIFGQTNRKLISLAPGINELEILGATDSFTISFDFRFYYL